MLRKLASILKKVWTIDEYSPQFKKDKCPYRDFRHTVAHLFKAVSRLNEMVEEADHSGTLNPFDQQGVEKYLADIVISAVRAGIVAPNGEVDVEAAVYDRMKRKMGVTINDQAEKHAFALAESITECFSWRGEFNHRTAPCSTTELRAAADFVLKLQKESKAS